MAGPPRRTRVGVVGACHVDLTVRCAVLPRPGETVLGGDVVRTPGGKGGNQAAAAARLGANVTLVAAVGRDEAGEWLLEGLRHYGVDVAHVQRGARPTGTAFITLDVAGENEIVVSSGANAELDVSRVPWDRFDVVLAQMEVDPDVIDEAASRSRVFILNVAPAAAVPTETLARCAVVIANEVEAETLDLSGVEHCVVTLGARGAVHFQRGREVTRALASTVATVDTVGAGDVFCAAYATQFARGVEATEALRYSVAAASLATLGRGAQGALPSEREVVAWLAHD